MSQSRAEREATNALLRQYGYRWRKHENDEEDRDLAGLPQFEWVLHDTKTATATSYGNVVTVYEAMETIAAQGNTDARTWLERHPRPLPPEVLSFQIARGDVPYTPGELVMTEQHGLLVVNTIDREWIREDGWSLGLLAEQGWLYRATCRKAGAQEVRTYEADQERLQTEVRRREHEAEVVRWRTWKEEHLAGLVCTTLHVPTPPRRFAREYQENWQPTRVHFNAGWHDTGTTYHRFELEGEGIYTEDYGNASRTWLPPGLAEKYYRLWWEQGGYLESDGPPAMAQHHLALAILERACEGFTTFGSDIYQWVFEHVGEQRLIGLVRAAPPVEAEHGHYALASKWYRLPIRAREFAGYQPGSGNTYNYFDGYGQRRLIRGSGQDEESWLRDQRLHGWVALGEEERGPWPTEEDLTHTRAWSEEASRAFSSIFGD
jgi:hypothetical protein